MTGVLPKPFSIRDLRALLGQQPPPSRQPRQAPVSPEQDITPAMLADAIDNDQIRLMYQPKVSCAEGRALDHGGESVRLLPDPVRYGG